MNKQEKLKTLHIKVTGENGSKRFVSVRVKVNASRKDVSFILNEKAKEIAGNSAHWELINIVEMENKMINALGL